MFSPPFSLCWHMVCNKEAQRMLLSGFWNLLGAEIGLQTLQPLTSLGGFAQEFLKQAGFDQTFSFSLPDSFDLVAEKVLMRHAKELVDCPGAIALPVRDGLGDEEALLMVKGRAFAEDWLNDPAHRLLFADVDA